ncbi:MAG: PhoX family phosphatase [Planctomycetes bacterium]|nr:PhoX family phosphatase [Planctomycetota bacterium]
MTENPPDNVNLADEDGDNESSNPSPHPSLARVIELRLSRREALGGLLASVAAAGVSGIPGGPSNLFAATTSSSKRDASTLTFEEIDRTLTPHHRVSPGYRADVLIRWGDRVFADAPEFDPLDLDPSAQARQFGYNNDYIAFMPLPRGSDSSSHGLLCVSHEYTNARLMFARFTHRLELTERQAAVEMMAHGQTIIEIALESGVWKTVPGGKYNRRITPLTPMTISGPAAGHPRMQTTDDPTGRLCLGTLNNCAGGVTPWGTVLITEENFNYYFVGDRSKTPEADHLKRYGIPSTLYSWGNYHERFQLEKEPHEANRFGWVVEIDPYDPESVPVKRTALGRFKHEGATVVVNHDGRVVVYSGDDQRYEYVYKFVSNGIYDAESPEANRRLLDDGILYVAKFIEDGTCEWMPLVWGQGPLTPENGFHSQADVLIAARQASDRLEATPMDRPEDVEPNPVTGKVYIMLTKNPRRTEEQIDTANPRAVNRFGHIIELEPPEVPESQITERGPGPDHAATTFKWNIFLQAGDPEQPEHEAVYHPDVSRHGWLVNPDNAAFDNKGRLWISTDQGEFQPQNNIADGMWATDTQGEGRALTKMFFACPVGAEMCGPCFTPDGTTMFLAVQHPGEGNWEKPSTFASPLTRWPDFQDGVPPRPSVVAVRRDDGGEIGG